MQAGAWAQAIFPTEMKARRGQKRNKKRRPEQMEEVKVAMALPFSKLEVAKVCLLFMPEL